jgi:hypothetical protein
LVAAGKAEVLGFTTGSLAESGGSHNQQGIEFQKHWAILRIFELESARAPDFIALFEVVQDVAFLDSAKAPTSIHIYQVKKRDKISWTWSALTQLDNPSAKTKKKAPECIQDSNFGKLYAAARAFKALKSTACFVSDAGCDLPLATGENVADYLETSLAGLESGFATALSEGLETFHSAGEPPPDLSKFGVRKTALPAADPATYVVGKVYEFLLNRSARHAGQAQSLFDTVVIAIGRLGSSTYVCATFEELCQRRGFSRDQLSKILGSLDALPDRLSVLDKWLAKLSSEGMGYLLVTAIANELPKDAQVILGIETDGDISFDKILRLDNPYSVLLESEYDQAMRFVDPLVTMMFAAMSR